MFAGHEAHSTLPSVLRREKNPTGHKVQTLLFVPYLQTEAPRKQREILFRVQREKGSIAGMSSANVIRRVMF